MCNIEFAKKENYGLVSVSGFTEVKVHSGQYILSEESSFERVKRVLLSKEGRWYAQKGESEKLSP